VEYVWRILFTILFFSAIAVFFYAKKITRGNDNLVLVLRIVMVLVIVTCFIMVAVVL